MMLVRNASRVVLILVACSTGLFAQAGKGNAFYGGMNIGHSVAVGLVSKAMSDTLLYLPIHLDLHYVFGRHVGIAGSLIYRMEVDGDNFTTHEIGAAVGPGLYLDGLRSAFASVKVGAGRAAGRDYFAQKYERWDLVLQPEAGMFIPLGNRFRLVLGIGLQSLFLLSETPDRGYFWDWNGIGEMSHYYLPVLNVGFGATL